MKFTIYHANCTGVSGNCSYPHITEVTDKDSLARAVGYDYVCAEYRVLCYNKVVTVVANEI